MFHTYVSLPEGKSHKSVGLDGQGNWVIELNTVEHQIHYQPLFVVAHFVQDSILYTRPWAMYHGYFRIAGKCYNSK